MVLKTARGPWVVSTLTLELPARDPRAFQPDHYKLNGHPAFHLTTVLITIFYPTDRSPQPDKSKLKPTSASEKIKFTAAAAAKSDKQEGEDNPEAELHAKHQARTRKKDQKADRPTPLHWLNTPRLRSIEGLLKFAGLPKWVALPVILPAYRAFHARLPYETNAPLSTKLPDADRKEAQDSPLANLIRAQVQERQQQAGQESDGKPVFPCAVFSHGLGGTRVTYSAYAAALASHGVVVAAIEHRDGTAPATSICSRVDDKGKAEGDSARYWEESLIWLSMRDLDPDPKVDPSDFLTARRAQLVLRRAEFIEALSVLRRLNSGEGDTLERECLRTHYAKKTVGATPAPSKKNHKKQASAGAEDSGPASSTTATSSKSRVRTKQGDGIIVEVGSERSLNLREWQGRLDIENAWALGHSFGAATVIEVMRTACTPPSLELDPKLATSDDPKVKLRPEEKSSLLHPTHQEVEEAASFKHAVVLDPWTEPIEGPGRAQTLTRPLFIINSEAFTVWHKNFDPLRKLAEESAQHNRAKEGWLVTLAKTRHTDFSDYPFVLKTLFGSDVSAKECTRVFTGLTLLQIAARASTSKISPSAPGPQGGEQAGEGPSSNGGATSVMTDVIQTTLSPKEEANVGLHTVAPTVSDADGAKASFWAGVDALMNKRGNESYRAADKDKSKYEGCVKETRLRVEWENEPDQDRLGRPYDAAHLAKVQDGEGGQKKKKEEGNKEHKCGNERPGVLVVHPLGTLGSCPQALLGHGRNGAATVMEDAGKPIHEHVNGHATSGTHTGSAEVPASPVRKMTGSIRGASFTLRNERQLSQDDRTPRRKSSRLEP
ncbi:hypothetical protein OC845_004913 [Tilletia horrida]|nr:hypothetical protein OC845_004913 [Tilletia horrida]